MLGGVAEVVSSNPSWAIKYFSAFSGIVDLLSLSLSLSLSLYIYIYLCVCVCVCVCVSVYLQD